MKSIEKYWHNPNKNHIDMARKYGNSYLDSPPPEGFYNECPSPENYKRTESGCLIKTNENIQPHCDAYLASTTGPRKQRSLFWILEGSVIFKVDGFKHLHMNSGDWVIFDHRLEHLVMAQQQWLEWLAAAWQLRFNNRPQ